MFDVNKILARLNDGEDPDAIAKEYTDALNAAVSKKKEADEKAAKAKAKAAKAKEEAELLRNRKIADATEIVKLVQDYMAEYHSEDLKELKAEDVVDLLDSIKTILDGVQSIKVSTFPKDKASFKLANDWIEKLIDELGF